jgi:hypothetical protein
VYNLASAAQSEPRLTPKAVYARTGSVSKLSNGPFGTTVSKRAGTAAEEYGMYSSPQSIRTMSDFEDVEVVDRNEIPLGDDEDDFEGLENVRACCGGKHDGAFSLPFFLFPSSSNLTLSPHAQSGVFLAVTVTTVTLTTVPRPPNPNPTSNMTAPTRARPPPTRPPLAPPGPRSPSHPSLAACRRFPSRPLSPLPLNGNNGTIGRRG